MISATYSVIAVDGATLNDGETSVLFDNTPDPTPTYRLSKTDGIYLIMKDDTEDDKLAAISVQGTIIDIDVELAGAPITTTNADASESAFTVKPSAGVATFRVDATGISPKIYGVDEIELLSGKVFPQDGQIIKPAKGSEKFTLPYVNGTYTIGDKTITIGGLADDATVDIELNKDGNINSVYRIPKDAYVIYDGVTYTAPFDAARLSFDEDPCYFDGYTLPAYFVAIDPEGNFRVNTGIQFGKVISSGKTLGYGGTIEIDGEGSSVSIINRSGIPLTVGDCAGNELAENLKGDTFVTFSGEGVSAASLHQLAGATVYLAEGQTLTAKAPRQMAVTARKRTKVFVNAAAKSIRVDGSAVIDATAFTERTWGDTPDTDEGADDEDEDWYRAGDRIYDGVKDDLVF